MRSFRTISGFVPATLAALLALASVAGAQPRAEVNAPEEPQAVVPVAADCHAIGRRVAAENGGTLVQATAQDRGGQTVCRIVVLVPGKSGERPRRAEFTVPAG